MNISVSYGEGEYIEGREIFKGKIILNPKKLYLKGPDGDIPSTFIPLDKIERVKKSRTGLEIYVRPTVVMNYTVRLKGNTRNLSELTHDLVKTCDLKKRFLRKEWVGQASWVP